MAIDSGFLNEHRAVGSTTAAGIKSSHSNYYSAIENPAVQAALDLEERARALLEGRDKEHEAARSGQSGKEGVCMPAFTTSSRPSTPPRLAARCMSGTAAQFACMGVAQQVIATGSASRSNSPIPSPLTVRSGNCHAEPVLGSPPSPILLRRQGNSLAELPGASGYPASTTPVPSQASVISALGATSGSCRVAMPAPLTPSHSCRVITPAPLTPSGSCIVSLPAAVAVPGSPFGSQVSSPLAAAAILPGSPFGSQVSPQIHQRARSISPRPVSFCTMGATTTGPAPRIGFHGMPSFVTPLTSGTDVPSAHAPMSLAQKCPPCAPVLESSRSELNESKVFAKAPRALSAPFFFKPRDPPESSHGSSSSSRSTHSEKSCQNEVAGPLTKPSLNVNCQAADMVKLASGVVERGRPPVRDAHWQHAQATMEWFRGQSASPLPSQNIAPNAGSTAWPRSVSPQPLLPYTQSLSPQRCANPPSNAIVTPTLDRLVGTWVYSTSDDRYCISKTLGGQLYFKEENASGQTAHGTLQPDGPWFTAPLSSGNTNSIGTIRLRFRGAQTLLSNFRGVGEAEWGPDTIAQKVSDTSARSGIPGQALRQQMSSNPPTVTMQVPLPPQSQNFQGLLSRSTSPMRGSVNPSDQSNNATQQVPCDDMTATSTVKAPERLAQMEISAPQVVQAASPSYQVGPAATVTTARSTTTAAANVGITPPGSPVRHPWLGHEPQEPSFYEEVGKRKPCSTAADALPSSGRGNTDECSTRQNPSSAGDRGRSPWRFGDVAFSCGSHVDDRKREESMPMRDFLKRAGSPAGSRIESSSLGATRSRRSAMRSPGNAYR